MFSLNVPLPPPVHRLAADLAPALAGFDRVREDRTLLAKRLGSPATHEVPALKKRVRRALADAGTPPFGARIDSVDVFETPPNGPGPVVYLVVDSPGLRRVHEALCAVIDPAPGIEGDGYVPHVTLARGGARDAVDRLAGRAVGPVEWTVEELAFYDADYGERAGVVRLPA